MTEETSTASTVAEPTTTPDDLDSRPPKQEQLPASDEIIEVAPGVLRLQLPIDMPSLGHVNMYAIEDGDGLAVVDPGVPGKDNWDIINARLKAAGFPLRRVHTVVVTHSHPDHFGGAGLIAKETGARVVTSDRFTSFWQALDDGDAELDDERTPDDEADFFARMLSPETHDDDGNELPPSPFVRTNPWGGRAEGPPPERLAEMRDNMAEYLQWFRPPQPTLRLSDNDPVMLGGREWFAVFTPGHTDDHLCLFDPTEGLFLSGDHVLPTITPHVSGLIEGDSLAQFINSLDRVAAIDGVTAVLPAHGHPFSDLPKRVDEIKRHHDERLQKLRDVSAGLGWATVEGISHEMFRPRSWGPMADSETYAHIEYLRLRGQADRREAAGGVLEYVVR
jgi:glyoxylase-like metal-dependent hydrolase (beta-lactamase superfamily II)